jgi:diguanylate cyclase (GGDEF)-like protein
MGCRNYDYVARMGGDEFLIVASNMTPQLVREKTQQLNVLAREAARNICGDDVLSLSLGAAFYPTDGLDAVRLLAQADRNMYAAKNLHYANREPRQPSASERPYLVSVA